MDRDGKKERDSAADDCCGKHTANNWLLLVFNRLSRDLIYSMAFSFYLFTAIHSFMQLQPWKLKAHVWALRSPRAVVLLEQGKGGGVGRTVEHMDDFGLPLCIGQGCRLLHTAPYERHHKSAGWVVSAGVEGEMEDLEKARARERGKGRRRGGILSVKEIERVERGRGGGDWEKQRWG